MTFIGVGTWLLPGRWGWLALAHAVAWRFAGLWSRGAIGQGAPPLDLRASGKGVAWDLAFGLALLVLGKAIATIFPTAAKRAAVATGVAAAALLLLRAGDAYHCYLARSHTSAESFVYLEGGFGLLALQPRTLAAIGVVALLLAAHATVVAHDVLGAGPRSRPLGRMALAVAVLLGVLPAARAAWDQWRYPPHEYELRLVPEWNFLRQLAIYRQERAGRAAVTLPAVEPARWHRWQQAGLVPRERLPDDPYPLLRASMAEPPLPFLRTPAAPARPDVVLVILESNDRLFVDGLSGRFAGLMPHLSGFATTATSIEGYFNTASPTIAGLVATLCSIHPAAHTADLAGEAGVDAASHYVCAPELLRRAGWRTAYVQGADLEGVGTGRFLRAHGFDEVLGPEEMRRTTPKATFSGMGAHDRWTMDLALATLRRLRLARARDGRPFLLTVMNLDPHEPGLAPPGCHLPTGADGRVQVADVPNDPGAVQALAAYHCADREVGRLLAALDEPGERERTLVVVTADHAAFRTRSNDQVFRGVRAGWSFDRLPLLIRDPTHALPRRWDVLAGTQDVAPTLLHLLGLEGAQTAMGGLSVFGRRRDLPWIAGRIGRRLAYVNDGTQQAEWPVGALPAMCAARRPLLPLEPAPASDGPSPRVTFATPSPRPPDWAAPAVDACDLEHWLRWQDALWTLRRVHPALPAAAAPSQ